MSDCLQSMEQRNVEVVWLGVWEENVKAITFYEKFNFQKVGQQMFTLGSDIQRDALMSRRVKKSD